MIPPEAFFTIHADLPREGPGCAEDVIWACDLAGVARDARILDAGCGPGADIAALLEHAPIGSVLGVDKHAPFIAQARQLYGQEPRVSLHVGDMADADGPFDFIWCAGALYFLGIETGLEVLRQKLSPGGAIAFSHLVYTVDAPDPEAQAALQAEMPDIDGIPALSVRIRDAGFDLLGQRVLQAKAWAAYYEPMRARFDTLRSGANAELQSAIAEHEAEIALYDRIGAQFGYVLSVVRPG